MAAEADERRAGGVALALLLIAILPTNLKLLVDGARSGQARIPAGMLRGFEWIERNTPPDARAFTSMLVGQYCCRYALRHVHAAHLQVTVAPERKRAEAEEFFAAGTEDGRRREILRRSGCGWVAATPEQARALGEPAWLHRAHDAGALVIYRFPEPVAPPTLAGP